MERAAGAFVFTLALTALLTAVWRGALLRWGRLDPPRPDRWHRRPVPRPGGPAMVVALAAGLGLWLPRPVPPPLTGFLVGGAFIFGVGLLDDLVNLANPLKLTLLITGAAIPLLFDVSFSPLPDLVGVPLAMLWILVITNAVNWLDNMDGLAAGVSLVAAAALTVLFLDGGDAAGAVAAAALAGVCAGFLIFNVSPARIFMGDSGSGVLGFGLAGLALWGSARHITNVVLALLVPVMVLSIPIFDSAVVTVTRLVSGRRLFQGGRDHPSHRLVVLGLTERQAVAWLSALSALSGGAALLAARHDVWLGVVLAGGVLCSLIVVGIVLTRVQGDRDPVPRSGRGAVILWQLTHKRRLAAMALDLVLVALAYVGAYLLRFEGDIPRSVARRMAEALPLVLSVKVAALYAAGVYRGDWRYAGLLDLVPLARGVTLGSVSVVALLFLWTRLAGQSRAALVIDWGLTLGVLGTMRVGARLLQEYIAAHRRHGRPVLIAGAGQGGVLLLQELRYNPAFPYRPVGFVDDDPLKQGAVIRGVPVVGTTRDIPALVRRHRVEAVLVAAPSLRPEALERIRVLCDEAGVPVRLMRTLLDPVEG